jgi:hypothetical protein
MKVYPETRGAQQIWYLRLYYLPTAYENILIYEHLRDRGVYIGYSTIETQEVARIGYNGFLFRMSTGKFFCFNNNVSNLYNNSVVLLKCILAI